MKRTSMLGGLCLVAVFAFSTASASAVLPEFSGPFSKTFTSTSGATLFETKGGAKTTCTADTNSGEITGPQTGTVTIVFTGCKLKGIPCNTPGAGSGTIVTNLLSMRVGYINKAKKEVGVDLVPSTGGGFLAYGCGSALFAKVEGSVIGRITPINILVSPPKTFILKFFQAAGIQQFTNLEGSPIDILETSFGGPFEQTGLKSIDRILFGAPVKLIA